MKYFEIFSLIPQRFSKNIPKYQKKSEIFLTFEKSKKIYHFCAKNCPNGYIDRNMVKFSPKTTEHYQFFLTPFFFNFLEPTLSKICSIKSLSKYWVENRVLPRNFLHISQTTFNWAHFTDHILLITFHWSHFTEHIFYIRTLSLSVC